MSEPVEIRNIVEAALLASGRPLKVDELVALFQGSALQVDRAAVRSALRELGDSFEDRAVELIEVSSGYRIQVRATYASWIGLLWAEKPAKYSRALLETLALIAYRQPATRGEIEDIRGVGVSSSIMKTLQEREWVRVLGHREVPGRPALYGTTRTFLDDFNLRGLEDLPPLAEVRDIDRFHSDLFAAPGSDATPTVDTGDASAEDEHELDAAADDTTVVADGDTFAGDSEHDPDSSTSDLDTVAEAGSPAIEEEHESDALEDDKAVAGNPDESSVDDDHESASPANGAHSGTDVGVSTAENEYESDSRSDDVATATDADTPDLDDGGESGSSADDAPSATDADASAAEDEDRPSLLGAEAADDETISTGIKTSAADIENVVLDDDVASPRDTVADAPDDGTSETFDATQRTSESPQTPASLADPDTDHGSAS
jgi:segregation and condensation protein B